MDFVETEITEVERHGPSCALLRFAGPRPIAGRPGQFVMVRGKWGTDPILARAFSLVEVGARGAIFVRAVGKGTRLLVDMRPGDALSVLGPAGRGFSAPPAEKRPVLVAGGVGVAPILFLAESLAAEGRRAAALLGARSAADLALAERLASAADLTVTTEDGSRGEQGLVTAALARVLDGGPPASVFACGPERMLEAVARLAAATGAGCEVAMESPMACGKGTCKGCAVLAADGTYRYVCSDGPVFDSAAIYGGAA